jgi:hypothetical protein
MSSKGGDFTSLLARLFMVSSLGVAAAPCLRQAVSPARNAGEPPPRFQPLIQRTLSDDNPERGGSFLIDFDTGRLHSPPAEVLRRGFGEAIAWMTDQGIDAMCEGADGGLIGLDFIALRARNEIEVSFPDFPEEIALRQFQLLDGIGKAGTPVSLNARAGIGPAATYLFKTREGAKGVLQVAGWDEESQAVRLNYRLLGTRTTAPPDSGTIEEKADVEPGLGAVVDRSIKPEGESHLLDLDADELRPIPPDPDAIRAWNLFIREGGVEVQVKPFATREVRFYDVAIVGAPREWWDDPRRAASELRWLRPAAPARTFLFRDGARLPATFLFKTEAGARGILQVVAWDDESKAVRLRYRKISDE